MRQWCLRVVGTFMTFKEVILSGCPFKRSCWDKYDDNKSNWYRIENDTIYLIKNLNYKDEDISWPISDFLSMWLKYDDFIIDKKYKHNLDFKKKLKKILV